LTLVEHLFKILQLLQVFLGATCDKSVIKMRLHTMIYNMQKLSQLIVSLPSNRSLLEVQFILQACLLSLTASNLLSISAIFSWYKLHIVKKLNLRHTSNQSCSVCTHMRTCSWRVGTWKKIPAPVVEKFVHACVTSAPLKVVSKNDLTLVTTCCIHMHTQWKKIGVGKLTMNLLIITQGP